MVGSGWKGTRFLGRVWWPGSGGRTFHPLPSTFPDPSAHPECKRSRGRRSCGHFFYCCRNYFPWLFPSTRSTKCVRVCSFSCIVRQTSKALPFFVCIFLHGNRLLCCTETCVALKSALCAGPFLCAFNSPAGAESWSIMSEYSCRTTWRLGWFALPTNSFVFFFFFCWIRCCCCFARLGRSSGPTKLRTTSWRCDSRRRWREKSR